MKRDWDLSQIKGEKDWEGSWSESEQGLGGELEWKLPRAGSSVGMEVNMD